MPLAIYWPILGYGFLLDDFVLFETSPSLSNLSTIFQGFWRDLGGVRIGSDEVISGYYRPVFLALSTLYYQAVGAKPGAWHFVSLILAALLGWAAYRFFVRFDLPPRTALLASLVFSLHPSHVGSVAWASGLQELLAALFSVFAILSLRARKDSDLSLDGHQSDRWPIAWAATFFVLAVLSKEVGIALPAFVALWAYLLPPQDNPAMARRLRRATWVLSALAASYLVARVAVLGGVAHPPASAPSFASSIASVPVAFATYLKMLAAPVFFSFFRPERPHFAPQSLPVLLSVVAILGLTLAAIWFVRKRRSASGSIDSGLVLPIVWTVLWLGPVMNLWALDPQWMVTDRYLLIPSLGLPWFLARALPPRVVQGVLASLVAAFALLTLRYSAIFESESSFFEAMAKAEPTSSTVFAERGRLLLAAGEKLEARRALERAVELDPLAPRPLLALGEIELENGEFDRAEQHFRQALVQRPYASKPFKLLAIAHAQAGRREVGLRLIEEAAKRWPEDFEVQLLDAIFLGVKGDRARAEVAFAAAERLRPQDPALAGGFDATVERLRGTIAAPPR